MQLGHRSNPLFVTARRPRMIVAAAAFAALAATIFVLHPPATYAMQSKGAVVSTAKTSLGRVLVNSNGRTLYLFSRDSGTTSECSGACAVNWPPLRVTGKPTIGSGAKASLIATTTRADGARQVTYNGHPLYLFKGDGKAGDTKGEALNAFGGNWYALSPAGNEVQAPSSGGGYGY